MPAFADTGNLAVRC